MKGCLEFIAGICAPVLLTAAVSAADTNSVARFLLVQRGELPILITAPHGGAMLVPGVTVRTNEGIVITQDMRTLELARATARRVEELLGKKPYLVAMQAHRRFLDVNRPVAGGVEHSNALPVHVAFHSQVRGFVDELRRRHPGGALLLDVHGQVKHPELIHRGTQNGTTVMGLVSRHGVASLVGEHSIFGGMARAGIKVYPPNTPPGEPVEDRSYNGGFIVRTYGSHTTNGVDAIQLEFGSHLRTNDTERARSAEALAQSIKTFYEHFLAGPPKPAGP